MSRPACRQKRIRPRTVRVEVLLMVLVCLLFAENTKAWTLPRYRIPPFKRESASTSLQQAVQVQSSRALSNEGDPAMSRQPDTSLPQASTHPKPHTMSAFEQLCASWIDVKYHQALDLKCPFMRRRATDVLDNLDEIMRFLLIRHKSLDLLGPRPAYGCDAEACDKILGLDLAETMQAIRRDWKVDTRKGYYITGHLNATIYRDDCFFDGPDPDMPIRGLRKYLNAASQLFEQKSSHMELLSLEEGTEDTIVATWKMDGVLRLPWKPKLPTWTGTTTYYLDAMGLIYKHTETWDMSVVQAFVVTLWPDLARRVWCDSAEDTKEDDGFCAVDN